MSKTELEQAGEAQAAPGWRIKVGFVLFIVGFIGFPLLVAILALIGGTRFAAVSGGLLVTGEIMLVSLRSPDGTVSALELRAFGEFELRNRLLSVPGVSQVVAIGGELPEYQVNVDQARLRLYGLTITRQLPKRISKLREEILFERIPALREEVASRAQRVMTELLRRTDAPALADYYCAKLIPYFVQPRGALFAVRPTSRQRNRLHAQLDELDRYESSAERTAAQQLRQLIDKRDDLDYHQAQQRKLKVWLFAHIGLTAALLMAASLHVVLAHAFWGGLP